MTTQININTKSQLAKLIATENLTVQHNNVQTASFDTLNRILTLPIFKVQTGDIYDMLIAHECSHALFTPTKSWQAICHDNELRAYVNVIEDCRIDKKIQKKYPGVVKNYLQGFDDMMSKNFFGLEGKDYNKDLMLIDKINMYYKSSKRLDIDFSNSDKIWVKKVDEVKSFKDVVELSKKMLDWQKKQLKKLKKLPDFDTHPLVENYNLDKNKDSDNNVNTKDSDSSDNNSDKSNETNNNDKDSDKDGNSKSTSDDVKDGDTKSDKEKPTEQIANDLGAGSGASDGMKLTSVTNISLDSNKERLYDNTKTFNYVSIPDVKLKDTVVSYKTFIKDMRLHIVERMNDHKDETKKYVTHLKNEYKKFKSDNKKTVMYLVKEFEMKKAATAYKKATNDKTGVIDPLKLKNYKFSDDIFKRLTILPDSKNHGMIMLLDWSGSMSDVLSKTVDQLINLIYFCQKINIPYEVYFFNSKRESTNYTFDDQCFNYKHNDFYFDPFILVNVASHRMKKTELDESLMYLYSMAGYFTERYTRQWYENRYDTGSNYGMPDQYWLGNTPLNEALVACDKLIKIFKQKYNIEKLSFITLTDGASNYARGKVENTDNGLKRGDMPYEGTLVVKDGKKSYTCKGVEDVYYSGEKITSTILDSIKKKHNVKTIGFYLIKRTRGYENERFFRSYGKDRDDSLKRKKDFTKDKVCTVDKPGYDEYFLVNVKNMAVQNTDLSSLKSDMKAGRIKQIFSKSMKGRITSRVLLNKFIQNVA